MKNVMRLQVDEHIELINGKGLLAQAKIVSISKTDILTEIQHVLSCTKKPPFVRTALPLLRPGHFDWALEKVVELGVDHIALFIADLSERKETGQNFMKRCEKIIESAMKQSGRLFHPTLSFSHSLQKLLSEESALVLWADESASTSLLERLEQQKGENSFLLLSGPEKGWSDQEKKLLSTKTDPVLLSSNTLRAETAAILMAGITILESALSQSHGVE